MADSKKVSLTLKQQGWVPNIVQILLALLLALTCFPIIACTDQLDLGELLDEFMIAFWGSVVGYIFLTTFCINLNPEKERPPSSWMARMTVVTLFFVFPLLVLSAQTYPNFAYTLSTPQDVVPNSMKATGFSIHGVRIGDSKFDLQRKWGGGRAARELV